MANMSYCRFQNTLGDLEDCYDKMNEQGFDAEADLSEDEKHAHDRLVAMCVDIAEDFGDQE